MVQKIERNDTNYPKALVNFNSFKKLVAEVEQKRKGRLVDLNEFIKLSRGKGTIILDTRSKEKYNQKHINTLHSLNSHRKT